VFSEKLGGKEKQKNRCSQSQMVHNQPNKNDDTIDGNQIERNADQQVLLYPEISLLQLHQVVLY